MQKLMGWLTVADRVANASCSWAAQTVHAHGWELTDRVFKLLAWIVAASYIKTIAHEKDDLFLEFVAMALAGLFVLAVLSQSTRLLVPLQDRIIAHTKSPVIRWFLGGLLTSGLLLLIIAATVYLSGEISARVS